MLTQTELSLPAQALAALADTGADNGIITTLIIIASVLGGLGVLLVVLKVIARRRVR